MSSPINVLTADGDNVLTADGFQLVVGEDPLFLPALSGVGRCGACRSGASGRQGFIAIDGVDRTNDIDWRTIVWTDRTGSSPGTLQFNLAHDVGDLVPRPDERVTLAIGSAENIQFWGNIAVFQVSNKHPTGAENARRYDVTVTDTRRDINRRRVTGVYTGPADDVVKQLIANFAPGFGDSFVQLGAPVIGEMSFKFVPFVEAMNRIAERTGWFWQVRGFEVAFYPLAVIESQPALPLIEGTWGWYRDPPLSVTLDITQQRNRIFVEGRGSQTAAKIGIGQTVIPILTDDNFLAVTQQDLAGSGYLHGVTLLNTTTTQSWTKVGSPITTVITAPLNEGPNSPAITLEGTGVDYIEEILVDIPDGLGLFSFMTRPTAGAPNTGIFRIQVRDETQALDLVDIDVDVTTPNDPQFTIRAGRIHRPPVPFEQLGFPDGWLWGVYGTDVEPMVAGNDIRFRLYSSPLGGPNAEMDIWGSMAQKGPNHSWHVPVDFVFLPTVAATDALRRRDICYLENELIAFRAVFEDEIVTENQVLNSHRLDLWLAGSVTDVELDIDTDTDGNATLDEVTWNQTGGGANTHLVGVDSLPTVVNANTDEGLDVGWFSLRVDSTAAIVNPPTGFIRIGFYDPTSGADLLTATNRIFAVFEQATGDVLFTGTGSGNPGSTVYTDANDQGDGLWQVQVGGVLGDGWIFGDQAAVGIYATNVAGDDEIQPNVDGEGVISGRASLVRGIEPTLQLFDAPVIQTGSETVVLSDQVSGLFGVPAVGQFLSITRTHGRGEDINPVIVGENQDAQLLRAEIVETPDDNQPQWVTQGPAEFYKRDRRLTAQGMVDSAALELIRWLSGPDTDNAIPTATYTTRDQAAVAGARVLIDVPIGWGVTFEGTIVSVSTTFLKQGLQEKQVEVALVSPRTLYSYMQTLKSFTVEEI